MSPTLRLLASFVALMMAMGIGRFALTPQLPHLVSEGQLSLTAAGVVAAANYLGYFLGALDAMFARRPRQVRVRLDLGLWLCVLLTLVSFWADGFVLHALLRFGTDNSAIGHFDGNLGVRVVHTETGGRLPIIGVGGVMTPDDAARMLDAGAALVQLYSGFIYHGPALVRGAARAAASRRTRAESTTR